MYDFSMCCPRGTRSSMGKSWSTGSRHVVPGNGSQKRSAESGGKAARKMRSVSSARVEEAAHHGQHAVAEAVEGEPHDVGALHALGAAAGPELLHGLGVERRAGGAPPVPSLVCAQLALEVRRRRVREVLVVLPRLVPALACLLVHARREKPAEKLVTAMRSVRRKPWRQVATEVSFADMLQCYSMQSQGMTTWTCTS